MNVYDNYDTYIRDISIVDGTTNLSLGGSTLNLLTSSHQKIGTIFYLWVRSLESTDLNFRSGVELRSGRDHSLGGFFFVERMFCRSLGNIFNSSNSG